MLRAKEIDALSTPPKTRYLVTERSKLGSLADRSPLSTSLAWSPTGE